MKVVHLSRFDIGDSASNIAYHLHRALLGRGIDSIMLVPEKRSNDPTVKLFQPPRDLGSRLRRRLRRFQAAHSLARYRTTRPTGYSFSDDRSPYGADVPAQLPVADIIHVHAIAQFVDYQAFFGTVPARTPVVRTLYNMNFFTGGCWYAFDCEKYTNSCGTCPQLGSRKENDLSRQTWQRKYTAVRRVPAGRLHIVAPSRWIARVAMRSSILQGFPISVIPFGMDPEAFQPRDKGFARETLGVPRNARVIIFVAEPITRPEKRFALVTEAVNGLREVSDLFLISVGNGKPELEVQAPYLNLGYIGNERLLSLVYSAADIFVLPTFQESFGLVVAEAMACGTPIVGTPVGGLAEMVRPGVTGQLVPTDDVHALRTGIRDILQDPARLATMSVNCRRVAVEEYSNETHAQHYAQFYEAILAGREPPEQFSLQPFIGGETA